MLKILLVLLVPLLMLAKNDDGRYDGSRLHAWFDSLSSGNGPCCSSADGFTIQNADWMTIDGKTDCVVTKVDDAAKLSPYCVRMAGVWYRVPEHAVVNEPNKLGAAVAWPVCESKSGDRSLMPCGYVQFDGKNYEMVWSVDAAVKYIRCFIPGEWI